MYWQRMAMMIPMKWFIFGQLYVLRDTHDDFTSESLQHSLKSNSIDTNVLKLLKIDKFTVLRRRITFFSVELIFF